MYHAKRIGGDRIELFKPAMRARRTDRLTLESELRRALDREEIKIVYQPIVRLEDRSVAGFEALARWDHPKMGRMSPAEFISIAEEIGLIVDLGLFVLERASKQLSAWQRNVRTKEPIFVSVNVSSRQLLRHDLIHDLRTVLSRAGLARGTLKLELTESLVMENPEHAAQLLQRIRELGAGLALDDFGTGHSSLSYLQRFPFDTIKIDQSFVRTNNKGTRPVILRSIISLAHDLGMDVVAEGAETDSDAVELYQLGCEFAQGFVFGEPMTPEAARKMLVSEQLEPPQCCLSLRLERLMPRLRFLDPGTRQSPIGLLDRCVAVVARLPQRIAAAELRPNLLSDQFETSLRRLPVGPILSEHQNAAEAAGDLEHVLDLRHRVVGRADDRPFVFQHPVNGIGEAARHRVGRRHDVIGIADPFFQAVLHVLSRLFAAFRKVHLHRELPA